MLEIQTFLYFFQGIHGHRDSYEFKKNKCLAPVI